MPTVTFYEHDEISDEQISFAVVAARYDGRWIYCRRNTRSTWELPSGKRENGEDITDTAKRLLANQTGAAEFTVSPVCAFGCDGYGMLCFAEVKTLAPLLPDSKVEAVELFGSTPDDLTYPNVQPYLHEHVQGWLNVHSNPDEIWDVYDENRCPTGRFHRRGDIMPRGDYHLCVHIWVRNSNGEFLLTKRTPNKGFPNMWECTGGSALAGDDSLSAALREVNEETGLELNPANGRIIMTYRRYDAFVDVWLFNQNFDLGSVVFLENETCGAMTANAEKVIEMRDDGILVPIQHLDEIMKRASE